MASAQRISPYAQETYLTPVEVSDYFGGNINLQTLANWRSCKEGPPFIKAGGKVLYPLSFLKAWEASRLRCATAFLPQPANS